MAKRTARELLDALEDEAFDEEMEEVLKMSPEERRRELEAAGFDLEKLDAEAEAMLAKLESPHEAKAPPVRPGLAGKKRARIVAFGGLGVAAAASVAMWVATASGPGSGNPGAQAQALRVEAKQSCDAQLWKGCLDRLNQAKELDPKGDEAPEVKALRKIAVEGSRP